jgi:uroporphyrinogen decarboxylase
MAAINHELPDRIPLIVTGITRPKPLARLLGIPTADDLPEIASGEIPFMEDRSVRALECLRDALGGDLVSSSPKYVGKRLPSGQTVWGTAVQGPFEAGYSQSRLHVPLGQASSCADIDRFAWPSPDEFDYEALGSVPEYHREKARVLDIGWEPFFDRILDLFGMEEGLMNIACRPDLVEASLSHIEDYVYTKTERSLQSASGRFDIFSWGDDFAGQSEMLISPRMWRKLFRPRYRRLIDLVKSYDLKFCLHSCGCIVDVLPDLVQIGVDIWFPCQVHLPGIDPKTLKRRFGNNIVFCGGINTQQTIPFGTEESVRRETRERIAVLGSGGGYICGPDHEIAQDVPLKNLLALYDEAKKFRSSDCTQ